jgi:glycosyltransferase involved in cell wall biosynthesis
LQKTIAICSPSNNVYSETFIKAHKERLQEKVFFYFNGTIPTSLEHKGQMNTLVPKGMASKWIGFRNRLFKQSVSYSEQNLIRSFKANKIEVILAEYGPTGTSLVRVCQKLGLPLLVFFHGYDASVDSVIKSNDNYHKVIDYASYIFVVSKKMERKLLELGCPQGKLVYNVYGPDESFFKVQPLFTFTKFVAIGRFVDKKAPYYTILAFSKVVQKFPSAQLVMGGDGPLWEACNNLIRYLGLERNITLLGVIDPATFQLHLKECLAFVQHSITAKNGDMEGTPVAVLEAHAAGVPVISTNHAGIPDVVINEENGFLVAEHDVDAMAGYMIRLIEEPGLAREMGAKGKKMIEQHFTMEKHINCIAEKITAVIAE